MQSNVPSHVPTWAYDEYWAEGAQSSSSFAEQWLTYAEGGYGNDKDVVDCPSGSACHSVFYIDPNFLYAIPGCEDPETTAFIAQASESWYVHQAGYTDAAHRVAGSYTETCKGTSETGPVYLINQGSTAVQQFFANYVRQNADSSAYLFMDDTSALVLTQAYGPGGGFCAGQTNNWCTATQEYPTDASVLAAHESLISALSHSSGAPVQAFFNGVSFSGSTVNNLDLMTQGQGRFVGAACEACVVDQGTFRPNMYAKVLTAMAQINAIPDASFVQLDTGDSPSGSPAQIAQRIVSTAVLWLGFSPGRTIDFENLEDNTQNLAVWPEEELYPTGPVESMSTSANDVAVTAGVYRREFAQCYLDSAPIGPCAALLNANASPVTVASSWLTQSYGHTIGLSGGDIESGGAVETSSSPFVANSTQIAAGEAVLLAR